MCACARIHVRVRRHMQALVIPLGQMLNELLIFFGSQRENLSTETDERNRRLHCDGRLLRERLRRKRISGDLRHDNISDDKSIVRRKKVAQIA